MTQVTGVQEFFEAMVEVRPAGGAWTDISGWGATVAVSGRERQVGEGFTHDGDRAIVGHGKLQPLDVTVRIIYTEGGLDPYAIVLPPLENHTVMQVRWSPLGGVLSNQQYTTNLTHSHVTSCPPPSGEAGSGDPVMLEFTVRTSDIAKDTVGFYYGGHYYWLGELAEKIASPVGNYDNWTDGVYHIEAKFCGWYTRGKSFTYNGDCDLRTLMGGIYTNAHLDRTVPASWHTSPCWTRVGSVLDQATSDAVAQHFWGMDETHPITGCTDRAIGADVSVGGWFQWGTAGTTVTFEVQAVYRD